MSGSELLVHISAPSKISDDRRYKQQLQGAIIFDAVIRHDVLTANRPVSPLSIQNSDIYDSKVRLPFAPLDEASITVRSRDGERSKEALRDVTNKRRKMDHQAQHNLREGKSIVSALQMLDQTNRTPAIQVKRTPLAAKPCIHVKRTPAKLKEDKLPKKIIEHFKRVRKGYYDNPNVSWETPPSVIPDSQPIQGPNYLKMSDTDILQFSQGSEQVGTQSEVSSQMTAASQSSEIHLNYPDWQGPTDSQQTASSQAEDSQPEDLGADEVQLVDGLIEDDYDPTLTSSQSLANEMYPQVETLKEFLYGKPAARPVSLPPALTSSSSPPTRPQRLGPLNDFIHYLPTPLPRHIRPNFTTHLTPYLKTLTSLTGPCPLSNTFKANILSHNTSFQKRSIWQRGNWIIPIASWPETAQITFWDNLKARIMAGEAGWPGAVNAHLKYRERSDDEEEEKGDQGKGDEGEKKGGGQGLRAWIGCWAEMKGEVWCLLWQASGGMVGELGGKAKFWVDGKKVLVMK